MSLLIQEDPGLARKRKLAEAMMQRGQRTGPVSHWTEGLSRIIDQGAGAYFANKAASQEEARKKASMESLAQAMAADGMGPPQPLLSRLGNVPGINQEMMAGLRVEQEAKREAALEAQAVAQGERAAKLEDYRTTKGIDKEFAEPKKRETLKDANNVSRYVDTGEKVFPDVEAVDPKKDKTAFDQEKDLRGEYQALTKSYRGVQDSFGKLLASAREPSAAGDMAMVFNFMKIMDEGVVRESEYALVASSGDYKERMQGMITKLANGERLTPSQRADFVDRGSRLYEEAAKGFDQISDQYKGLAEQYKTDPARVVSSKRRYAAEDYADLRGAGDAGSKPAVNKSALDAALELYPE